MSRSTKKKASEQEAQPQLIFDAKSDINPYWRSSLFSDVYLRNDVPREYRHLWDNDEIGDFYNFYQGFLDLCNDTEHECFDKWREADTVKNWIVPVMELLGWENNSERRQNSYMDNESFTVDENGKKQTYRPDLIYFDKPKHKSYTQKEKDIHKKLAEARNVRTGAKVIVEAKYWNRLASSDKVRVEKSNADSASSLGPELQTLKYIELFQHDFGILTDGKTWRLFHRELSQGMERRSFDFDIGKLKDLALSIDRHGNEETFLHYAKYFYYIFSKKSLVESEDSKTAPFVYEIFEYSKKYAHSIEDDLKKRFIISMGVICNSLRKSCEEQGEEFDSELVRNVAESHLFNILFVKSCEVRRVLPISSTQYLRKSLHEVVETMDAMGFDPDKEWDEFLRDFRFTLGKKFDWDGYEIFNRFINLYEIVHDGTAKSKDFGFEISGFKESVFSKNEWRFAKNHKISNRDMIEVLFDLNFIESAFKGRKYQQIPYSYFSPRQLGSIYESFLEYRLETADHDMVFHKGRWSKANLKSGKVKSLKLVDCHIVKRGEVFFSPDNKDRKMTGSYYTPDYIVQYIVDKTLGVVAKDMTSEELFDLKICDPAMGSGHFLAGALSYLQSIYLEKWSAENYDDYEGDIVEITNKFIEKNLYGIDLNPRAVKLAKMSIWLSSAHKGRKLCDLSQKFVAANTLKQKTFSNTKFDVVIGNPPYLDYRDIDTETANVSKSFDSFVPGLRPNLYVPFVEYGIKILKDDGYIGYIFPIHWCVSDSSRMLREYVLNSSEIKAIDDISSVNVFKDAGTYPSILIAERVAEPRGNYSYSTKNILDENLNIEEHSVEVESVLKDEGRKFLVGDNVSYLPVMNKLDKCEDSIESYAQTFKWGTSKTGYGKMKIKKADYAALGVRKKKEYRKIIQTSDIKRMDLQWNGEYIPVEIYSKSVMQDFEEPKLTIARVTKGVQAVVDSDAHFMGKASYILNEDVKTLKALCVVLNSSIVDFWFRQKFQSLHMAGGYIRYDIPYLKQIPLPCGFKNMIGKLSKAYDSNYGSKFKQEKIDDLVSDLYGLNKTDVRMIQDYLNPEKDKKVA